MSEQIYGISDSFTANCKLIGEKKPKGTKFYHKQSIIQGMFLVYFCTGALQLIEPTGHGSSSHPKRC